MSDIKRDIIIGADAKEFKRAMDEVNLRIGAVAHGFERMERKQRDAIFQGIVMRDVIRNIGQAFVQYITSAVESAQQLPEGMFTSVDALREARKEAEALDMAFGVMLSGNLADATEGVSKFKAALMGFNMSGGLAGINTIPQFLFNYNEYAETGFKLAESLEASKEAYEKNANQSKRWEQVQERLAKVATKRAEAEKKLAENARLARLEYEGLTNTIANLNAELENDIFNPKAEQKTFSGNAIGEATDLLRGDEFIESVEKDKQAVDSLNGSFEALASTMAGLWNTGSTALDKLLGLLTEMAVKIIATNFAIANSNAIAGATSSGMATGPAAIFTTPAFIASMLGVVASAFGSLPKFAHGGIVNGPTPLIAGEAGPEAIVPLHKLGQMGGTLTARISGRELLLLLEREQTVKSRGYGN
jgi:hypothetical protein